MLDAHPHLRAHLDVLAEQVTRDGAGPIADVGCGPGYVTRYLHDRGAEAFGIDLSPGMVALARRDHPDLRFDVGSMTALPLRPHSTAAVVALWSTIHVPDDAMPGVVREFHRVLRPGGRLLVGFHVGAGVRRTATGYTGKAISVDTHLRTVDLMARWIREGGFRVEVESTFRPDDADAGAIIQAAATPGGD